MSSTFFLTFLSLSTVCTCRFLFLFSFFPFFFLVALEYLFLDVTLCMHAVLCQRFLNVRDEERGGGREGGEREMEGVGGAVDKSKNQQ